MNIFNTNGNGLPLLARQNTSVYLILVFAAIIIALFFVIRFFINRMRQRRATPEWQAAQKNRPPLRADINRLATAISLSKEEAAVLWKICRDTKAPNVYYLVHEPKKLDAVFKAAYSTMSQRNEAPSIITALFKVRHHIERDIGSADTMTSTTPLREGMRLLCITPSGRQVGCLVHRNTAEGLLLAIPEQFLNSTDRPGELTKAVFLFTLPPLVRYAFSARIVRYEHGVNGTPGMFISHSTDVKVQAQRSSRRLDCSYETVFYAVIPDRSSGTAFVRKEKAHHGTIVNISGGGCCISTALPIKENQLLDIEIPIRQALRGTAIGRIVETRNIDGNQFALHIAFIQIEPTFQNTLYALAYGYLSDET
ncbi:MAG: PilZ domain-containing protein [Treponema sp.]|nr:PilZ domain-containing protein [Treponema sp.]